MRPPAVEEANTLRDRGLPIVIVTMRGNKSGRPVRSASCGSSTTATTRWSLLRAARPTARSGTTTCWPTRMSMVQDGPTPVDMTVHEVSGEEREIWWERSVAAYPDYADYQRRTDRLIPVFVATPDRSADA